MVFKVKVENWQDLIKIVKYIKSGRRGVKVKKESIFMDVFTDNIEKVILENFESAEKSILIAVAWFTNSRIISKLIDLKKFKNIDIQILTDDNDINKKYFFQLFRADLENAGIDVREQYFKKFNHNKFAVIDNKKIITGSYNYTYKANRNAENIVIETDKRIANFYTRVFNFFTDKNYIDPNVEILLENFDFANKLISMYYPFSPKLFSKLKSKITIGYCFTYENGLYNEINYEPGLIFNSRFKLHRELNATVTRKSNVGGLNFHSLYSQEFKLPVTKELICSFKINEINNFNYQTAQEIADYENEKIDFESLADGFQSNQKALEYYYTRKFKTIYSSSELREIIQKDPDIIIEDYIWGNNFAPFLSEAIVERIYSEGKINED